MILSEDVAKTKLCQERFAAPAVYGRPHTCQGSDCMAWRWYQKDVFTDPGTGHRRGGTGYCGKAGPPAE